MSVLTGLCRIHTVWLLEETSTRGPGGAIRRVYNYRTDLLCRMVPLQPSLFTNYGVQAGDFPHTIYATVNPLLTENSRVMWVLPAEIGLRNVFRMKGLQKNPDGMSIYWSALLTWKSIDNGVPLNGIPAPAP